jgi:hypothetical protein
VPFVRFSRDKRGYEHVYLVQASHTRGDATPARILYWYRTPPGVKVGREPFDEAARRALESEYPNIVFDWKRIINAPMPPPEAENWRERRRVERAMRQARAAEESEEEAPGDEEEDGRAASPGENPQAPADVPSPAVSTGSPHVAGADGQTRRRRRRGGGRRRKPAGPTLAAESVSAMETVSAAESASAVESVPVSESPDVHAADVLDPDEEE